MFPGGCAVLMHVYLGLFASFSLREEKQHRMKKKKEHIQIKTQLKI